MEHGNFQSYDHSQYDQEGDYQRVEVQRDYQPIILPKGDRVYQLKAKLSEYRRREAKEPVGRKSPDTKYKLAVLADLLIGHGFADIQALYDKHSVDPNFNEVAFWNAVGVVRNYCKNGGVDNAQGTGTGLPDVSSVLPSVIVRQ